jgi:hypothetical protein
MSNPFEQCVLLDLGFSRFGVLRKVKRAEVEVQANNSEGDQEEVPAEAIRLSKALVRSEAYEKIASGDGATMRAVASMGLPFRRGLAAIPVKLVDRIVALLQAREVERQCEVDAFVADYPLAIDRARRELGPLFRLDDYPTVEDVRASFTMRWTFVELGAASGLRNISQSLYEREAAKVKAQWASAAEQMQAALREAFVALVESLRERLDGSREGGKAKIFRDSRVDSLKEWVDLFDARNVTGDEALAQLVSKAQALLAGTSASELRDDARLRRETAVALGEIKASAATLVTSDAPRRRFRLTDED